MELHNIDRTALTVEMLALEDLQKKKALTFVLCSLLFTGEYHSSSTALGQQRPKITKQPLNVIGR